MSPSQYDELVLTDRDQEASADSEADWEARALLRFRVLTRDDLDRIPPPDPLISGLLPARGLAMLAGSRGLGKSLLSLSIAGAIATDLPTWMGMDVQHHGPVLYVSLEGFHGVPNRVRAWETWQQRRTDAIRWLPDPVNLRTPADAHQVAALARHLGAKLVVVDSARATGAGAEDTKDMSAYVHGLEILHSEADALVLVLHNTGWDGTRERGSTLLPDACDTTLILEGDPEGVRTLRHRKHRDGDMLPAPIAFTFRPVDETHSGVLAPTGTAHAFKPLRQQIAELLEREPGLSTGAIATRLGRHRPNVSTELRTLQGEGRITNTGTTQRPSWNPTPEEAAT